MKNLAIALVVSLAGLSGTVSANDVAQTKQASNNIVENTIAGRDRGIKTISIAGRDRGIKTISIAGRDRGIKTISIAGRDRGIKTISIV